MLVHTFHGQRIVARFLDGLFCFRFTGSGDTWFLCCFCSCSKRVYKNEHIYIYITYICYKTREILEDLFMTSLVSITTSLVSTTVIFFLELSLPVVICWVGVVAVAVFGAIAFLAALSNNCNIRKYTIRFLSV